MFDRKEDFLNGLRFKIGDRSSEFDIRVNSAKDLVEFYSLRHQKSLWPFLNFLPVYFKLKTHLEGLIGSDVTTDFNLNSLISSDKAELDNFLGKEFGHHLEKKRPKSIELFVFIFPVFAILGALLVSTYLITVKEYSGWTYVSGLAGFLISLGLFRFTTGLKTKYHPETLVEFAKAFYVVHHQQITIEVTQQQIETFVLDELETYFKRPFDLEEEIR